MRLLIRPALAPCILSLCIPRFPHGRGTGRPGGARTSSPRPLVAQARRGNSRRSVFLWPRVEAAAGIVPAAASAERLCLEAPSRGRILALLQRLQIITQHVRRACHGTVQGRCPWQRSESLRSVSQQKGRAAHRGDGRLTLTLALFHHLRDCRWAHIGPCIVGGTVRALLVASSGEPRWARTPPHSR